MDSRKIIRRYQKLQYRPRSRDAEAATATATAIPVAMKMPQFKIAISEARIHRTVRRMARQLDVYYAAQAVSQITVVCVMNATFVFCADLVRCLKTPARIVFTRARSYQGARKDRKSVV